MGVAQSEVNGAVQTTLLAVAYIAIMLVVVRPLAVRFLGHDADHPPRRMAVWVLVGLLFSAMTAEWIGIHAIFGAFLLGAIIPHDSDVARDFTEKLEDIVKILLLPAFFAYTGMRTEIGLVSGWTAWFFCALIILVATLGKFGGSFVAAQLYRAQLANFRGAGDSHEHARPDGADRAQHRPGAGRHFAHAVCHDGHHGARYDHRHDAGSACADVRDGAAGKGGGVSAGCSGWAGFKLRR